METFARWLSMLLVVLFIAFAIGAVCMGLKESRKEADIRFHLDVKYSDQRKAALREIGYTVLGKDGDRIWAERDGVVRTFKFSADENDPLRIVEVYADRSMNPRD